MPGCWGACAIRRRNLRIGCKRRQAASEDRLTADRVGGSEVIANGLQKALRYGSAIVVTLDQLPLGRPARIVAIDWTSLVPEEAQRLRALGLDEGARITLAYRGVFGGRDPLAVEVGRMTVAVRRIHARAMAVEELA